MVLHEVTSAYLLINVGVLPACFCFLKILLASGGNCFANLELQRVIADICKSLNKTYKIKIAFSYFVRSSVFHIIFNTFCH